MSDHKPVVIRLEMKSNLKTKKKEKRKPRIKWENLKEPENKVKYKQKVTELLAESNFPANYENQESTGWDEIARIVTTAAEDVCGLTEKRWKTLGWSAKMNSYWRKETELQMQ